MDVGTALLIALMVVVGRSLPLNDNEDDIDVCGNTCDYNQFCNTVNGTCLDCTHCLSSEYCTSQKCQKQDLETKAADPLATTNANQPLATSMVSPFSTETGTEISNFTYIVTELLESLSTTEPSGYDNQTDNDDDDKKASDDKVPEDEPDYLLASVLAFSGALVVVCCGAYMYFFHPLGCRSIEIIEKRQQMALRVSEGMTILDKGKYKDTFKKS